MPSIISKVKSALHSDTPGDRAEDVPGAFPDDREQASGRLRDGSEYVAPRGTAVGSHGPGRTSHEGAGQTTQPNVDDRHLMDPADRSSGSNVMSTTGAAGDPLTSSERATSASAGSHHNKLHKAQDPRGQETGAGAGAEYVDPRQADRRDFSGSSTGDPSRTSGTLHRQEGRETLTDDGRHGHHSGAGAAAAGGLAAAGAGGYAAKEIPERHHHQPTDTSTGTHARDLPQGRETYPHGQGVYNTVTGAGSGETHDRIDQRRPGAPTETYHTSSTTAVTSAVPIGASHRAAGQQGHPEADRYGGAATTTTDTMGASHPTAGHGHPEADRYGGAAAATTAGASEWPLGQSGSATDRRPVPTEQPIHATSATQPASSYPAGYHTLDPREASAGAVAAAGAGGYTIGSQTHDPRDVSSGVAGHPAGGQTHDARQVSSGAAGYPAGSQLHDPRDVSSSAVGHPTGGQTHDPRDISSGAAGLSGAAPGAMGSAKEAGTSAGGAGPESHYGPGHAGSKVLHKCTNCGHDNDITTYFRKDVTYRMG